MAIAHALGLARDFDLDTSTKAFAFVRCHFFLPHFTVAGGGMLSNWASRITRCRMASIALRFSRGKVARVVGTPCIRCALAHIVLPISVHSDRPLNRRDLGMAYRYGEGPN